MKRLSINKTMRMIRKAAVILEVFLIALSGSLSAQVTNIEPSANVEIVKTEKFGGRIPFTKDPRSPVIAHPSSGQKDQTKEKRDGSSKVTESPDKTIPSKSYTERLDDKVSWIKTKASGNSKVAPLTDLIGMVADSLKNTENFEKNARDSVENGKPIETFVFLKVSSRSKGRGLAKSPKRKPRQVSIHSAEIRPFILRFDFSQDGELWIKFVRIENGEVVFKL